MERIKRSQEKIKYTLIIFSMFIAVSSIWMSKGFMSTIPLVIIIPFVLSLFFKEDKLMLLIAVFTNIVFGFAKDYFELGIVSTPFLIIAVLSGIFLGKTINNCITSIESKIIKKIMKVIVSVVFISSSLLVYSSLFGNPISYLKARNKINSYIDKKYNEELIIKSMRYNLKMGGYYTSVSHKKYNGDSSYIGYSRYGDINDGYQFEVKQKIEEEVKSIIEALICQGTHLTRKNLGVVPSIKLPKFKYNLHDKYSGKEPIDLQILISPSYSYAKNEAEFAKDAYDVIKILQITSYKFNSIEIYSYKEDGNTSYKVKLGKNEKVNSVKELNSKVFIEESEKKM